MPDTESLVDAGDRVASADAALLGESAGAAPTCKCGYGRDHLMVSADCKYTMWGWFWVTFVGVTTRPIKVDFRCRVCTQTFDSSVDPSDLDRHT
jgi:hypothetical protein